MCSPRTSQRRSPPSTIATTMARSRCVRSAAISASTSAGARIRGNCRTAAPAGRLSPAGTAPLGSAGPAAPD